MASLPHDIIMDILSTLPVKSISRFRCVCKLWHDLFKNPKFIKMHLHHAIQNDKFSVLVESYLDTYTIDFDETSSSYRKAVQTNLPPELYADSVSCDGLIGLSNTSPDGDTILWNPSTREYKKISIPTTISKKCIDTRSRFGFCYDCKIDEYKLFQIEVHGRYGHTCSEVWVRRLGSNSWKSIGNVPYDVLLRHRKNVSTKPLNGIIHWIGNTKVIVSFDIVEEQKKEIQTPSCYHLDYSFFSMGVAVLGEDLYLSVNSIFHKGNIDLWVMKDYRVVDSWTKIFCLSEEECNFSSLWPLHNFNKNREILLEGHVRVSDEHALVSYDPKNGKLRTLDIPCIPKFFSRTTTFVGSLVSLNSGEFARTRETFRYKPGFCFD